MGAGLTSLGAVRLQESLAAAVGSMLREPLPATLAFDYPTPGALRAYVVGSLVVPAATTDHLSAIAVPRSGGPLRSAVAMSSGGEAAKLSMLDGASRSRPDPRGDDGAAIVGVNGVFPVGGGGILGGDGSAVDAIGGAVQIQTG